MPYILNISVGLDQVHTNHPPFINYINKAHIASTVPFTDNLHLDISRFVNVLLENSHSVIMDIPSSPMLFQLTFNSFNVVLPVMIMVDITNTYSSVRCGQLLTYNGHSVYLQLIMGLTCHHNLHNICQANSSKTVVTKV